jgi:hypothetical protein
MTESGYAASLEIDTVIMAAAGGVELAAGAAAIWPLIIPSPTASPLPRVGVRTRMGYGVLSNP